MRSSQLSYITFISVCSKFISIDSKFKYLPKSSAIRLQGNFHTSPLSLITVLHRCTKPPSYYSPLPTLTSFVFLLRKPYMFSKMSKNSSLCAHGCNQIHRSEPSGAWFGLTLVRVTFLHCLQCNPS